MKHRIASLIGLMAFSLFAFAQQYQMDVKTADGHITSYLMTSVNDVVYENGKTIININGSTKKEYDNQDIVDISWHKYEGSTSSTQNTFTIDGAHTTVVTPNYTISLSDVDAETKQTLTVNRLKSITVPGGFTKMYKSRVAYDISLGDKHELEGIAEIRLPMTISDDCFPLGLYYNSTTKKWENINHYYDKSTGELVIHTNHFSQFAGFEIHNENRHNLLLKYEFVSSDWNINVADVAQSLSKIVESDNIAAAAADTYVNSYGEYTQIGFDMGWTAMQSLGARNDLMEKYSEILGNLGVALSCYQVCRNSFKGEEAQVAGNTLKICMNRALYWAGKFCGNAILTASMASVAILDYSINKFAERAWAMRKDHYREAFEGYYRQGGKGYRTGADWYRIMKGIMDRRDLTLEEVHQKIDEEVVSYCNRVWNDEDYILDFESRKGTTIGFGGGNLPCKEMSAELRGELYNGVLQSVFARIKMKLEDKAYDEAEKQMKKYAAFVNQVVTLKMTDSSVAADGKSRFVGCTVRFKDLPKSIEDPEKWQCVLDRKGEGKIQYTFIAAAYSNVAQTLEVLADDEDHSVMGTFKLSDLNASSIKEEYEGSKANIIDLAQKIKSDIEIDPLSMEFEYEGGKATATIVTTGLSNLSVSTSAAFIQATVTGNTINITVGQNETASQRTGLVYVEGVSADGKAKKGYLMITQKQKPETFTVKQIGLIGLNKSGASYRSFNKDYVSCTAYKSGDTYYIDAVLDKNRTLKVTFTEGTGGKKFSDATMYYREEYGAEGEFTTVSGTIPVNAISNEGAVWKGTCMVKWRRLKEWSHDEFEEGEYKNDVETYLILHFDDISQIP